ncbi:MAG: HD-GYP domain-containing protein [Bacteriovoracia bacterium]
MESDKLVAAINEYYKEITNLKQGHIPFDIRLAIVHKMPEIPLFLPEKEGKFKLFRARNLYMSQIEIDTLADSGVRKLYLERSDVPAFTQYVEALLSQLPTSSPMVDKKKVELLRGSAIQTMSDIFENPSQENIQRGVKVVSNFVYILMKDPKAYDLLLGLSSHDPYTLQHSVGVATNSIILAKKIGIDDEASLIEVGVGGLLHDIGKTKVPTEIINKKGPLDEKEWTIMKKHALFGYEMIKDNTNIGTRAKLAVLQHHEDSNGTGYPLGLKGDQVDLFAKIVCLADIYNALTTNRSYSTAKPPFEAFRIIKDKMFFKVDPKLFEALVKIYGEDLAKLQSAA